MVVGMIGGKTHKFSCLRSRVLHFEKSWLTRDNCIFFFYRPSSLSTSCLKYYYRIDARTSVFVILVRIPTDWRLYLFIRFSRNVFVVPFSNVLFRSHFDYETGDGSKASVQRGMDPPSAFVVRCRLLRHRHLQIIAIVTANTAAGYQPSE